MMAFFAMKGVPTVLYVDIHDNPRVRPLGNLGRTTPSQPRLRQYVRLSPGPPDYLHKIKSIVGVLVTDRPAP